MLTDEEEEEEKQPADDDDAHSVSFEAPASTRRPLVGGESDDDFEAKDQSYKVDLEAESARRSIRLDSEPEPSSGSLVQIIKKD